MTNAFSIDLATLLLFIMPGFFFLWGLGYKAKSDFECLMFSMFWGILLLVLFYKIFPVGNVVPLLENPYAGAVVFSVVAAIIGFLFGILKRKFGYNLN